MTSDLVGPEKGAIDDDESTAADAIARERARIAQLIHDDAMQVISAVALHLQVLESERAGDPELAETLGSLATNLREAVARLWEAVFDHGTI